MLEEISKLLGLDMYTDKGVRLGRVENALMDVTNDKIDGLLVTDTNPVLVEGSANLNVPYRWVQAIGDVILLKHFPERVERRGPAEEEEKVEEKKEEL